MGYPERRGPVRHPYTGVRPEWSNPRELLGYRNVLKEGAPFVDGPLMPLLRRAAKDRGRFYFAVLDEMNLSHPEHYLSDILSAMESGGSVPEDGGPGSDGTGDGKVEYGTNIVLFGTVNYDETTLRLSPRLLSRGHLVDVRVPWKGVAEGLSGWEGDLANLLGALDGILKKADLGLGYRDQHFVSGYAMHHESERSLAIDEALCSRVLPRLRGGDEMADVLAKLTKEVKKVQGLLLPDESQLHERLIHLSERLKDRGFLL